MQTRVVIFVRSPGAAPVVHRFAVPARTLLQDLGDVTLEAFAKANALRRHPAFDGAVGDGGARCALYECGHPAPLPAHFSFAGVPVACQWLTFPQAARALVDGTDRRFLQLAVQFLSSGGITDDVVAADIDAPFLKHLKDKLSET